jgi:hypothetical protein
MGEALSAPIAVFCRLVQGQETQMLRHFGLLVVATLTVGSTTASAQSQFPLPFPPLPMTQGTPEERAACQGDVHKYCERELPDVMRVASCLQANRQRLTAACRQVLANRGM